MLFVVVLTLFALCNSAGAATFYAQSGGSGTCSSWLDACDLQYAISQSGSGDKIWVKAGTYLPTTGTDRTISFTLKNGVAIYGGFSETATDWAQRNPAANVTTLSGDIGISGVVTDNSYHVVANTGVEDSAILDGFTITGGNANGAPPHCSGGGMYNESSSPTLQNITFSNNAAGFDGGGMYNNASSPTLSNITFVNNTAGLQGGGIYNLKSRPVLTNVSFSGNSSEIEGVGAYNLVCSDSVIATTTTLTSSPNPSTYGTSVDFTATVTGSESSSTPTGTVTFTFKDGATTVNTGTLNGSGQATFSTSALAAGNYSITAVYAGDGSFSGSTSDPLLTQTQTVNKAGTTTAIASHTPDPSTFGQSVMVNFTATSTGGTPTGNVTVSDGTVNCTATVAAGSCSLTFTSAGSKTLTATYAGDANFSSSASAGVSHTVNKGATIAIVVNTPSPSTFGQSVAFTATVTSGAGTPTGTVTFSEGATTYCSSVSLNGSGQATCSTSSLSAGSHTITATYSGDDNYNGSSGTVGQTVNRANTTTTAALTTGTNPSTFGESVTFTAAVSSGAGTPTGMVTFKDGAITLGTGTLNGSVQATFSTSALAAGNHTITAVYSGDENFSGSTSGPLTQTVNLSPSITSGNSTSFSIGSTGSFTVTTTGYPVPSISSSGSLPSGLNFTDNNSGTATLWGTPGAHSSGQYPLTFTASNGVLPNATQSFTIMIANNPPVLDPIGNKQAYEGEILQFTITASDPDGDALSYDAGNLPTGATFDKNTQTFQWTPGYDQAGSYQEVLFTVTDDGTPMASDFEKITITVGNVNRPPELASIGSWNVQEGQNLQLTITATDPDGDGLIYSASNLPGDAVFDPTAKTFTWTPGYDQAGSYQNVLFIVTDDGTPPLSASEPITIAVGNVNRPPVLTPIGSRTVKEGEKIEIVITATDPDGDGLTYSTGNLPAGAGFDPNTQKFTWTPGYDQAGNYMDVLFTVTDNGTPPLSASEAITIAVGNVNRPPVLNPIGDKTVNEGETLTFPITATDADNDPLTYSASNLPPGAGFDNQVFGWTPDYTQAGNYTGVRFEVSDGSSIDFKIITITVGNINRPPKLDPIGDKTVNEGQKLDIVITATDPDGDGLTHSTSNLPTGATFDPITQKFNWTPGYDQAGSYQVTFSVSDGELNASGTITITVNDVSRPPMALCKDVTVAAGSSCTASASINNGSFDPDGDSITLTQSPAGPYALGNATVTLTVTDSNGASNQCRGTVTVVDNTPPTISNASAAPSELWPPNKKMVNVTINYAATDNCGQKTCNINSVTCNESISGSDYTIVDAHHVKLRADRLGSGNGRIYTINIICTDGSGNPSNQAVKVTVPHDQGKK